MLVITKIYTRWLKHTTAAIYFCRKPKGAVVVVPAVLWVFNDTSHVGTSVTTVPKVSSRRRVFSRRGCFSKVSLDFYYICSNSTIITPTPGVIIASVPWTATVYSGCFRFHSLIFVIYINVLHIFGLRGYCFKNRNRLTPRSFGEIILRRYRWCAVRRSFSKKYHSRENGFTLKAHPRGF